MFYFIILNFVYPLEFFMYLFLNLILHSNHRSHSNPCPTSSLAHFPSTSPKGLGLPWEINKAWPIKLGQNWAPSPYIKAEHGMPP